MRGQELEKRISRYQEGKIHIISCNGNPQYYLRSNTSDKSGTYISKRNHKKIQYYLQKKYDLELYRLVEAEKKNLEKFLGKSNSIDMRIREVYSSNPQEVKNNIIPMDISDDDYVLRWRSISFEKKTLSDDSTTYSTDRDELVRSKSELNIANTLNKMGVPYAYEKPFTLYNGRIIHPDFTVLDVANRREIYWEHRGMMDNLSYATHSVQRIKQLNKSGVVIGDNLVITEETLDSALGTDEIENVIKAIIGKKP